MINLEDACQQAGALVDPLVRLCKRHGYDPLDVIRDEFDGRVDFTEEQKIKFADDLKKKVR